MKIGLLQVELMLEGCDSLKDKRQILQSLKHRLRAKHNVSVAEIGDHDIWRRSVFGLVAIGNQTDRIEHIFRSVLAEMDGRPDLVVGQFSIEMF